MLKEYLLNFGFTEKDYENIISTPRSYSLRNDSLYKHILERVAFHRENYKELV